MLEITAKKLPQELQNIAVQNIGRGIETMFVLDDIQYTARVNGKTTTGEARGFAENGKVYIKVNNTYTAEQINGHETFHVDAGRYPREAIQLWEEVTTILPGDIVEVMFEQYRKEYSDVYSSAKIIEFAREEILADIAGEMNPLSEIPEVREAVGRFYDEIYGKGAGEEFQRGIEGSRYSVKKAAEEPVAFSLGKERDDAAEIMDYFEGTKAEQGREMSLEAMMEDAARSEKGMSAEDADAAAREIMEEMGGEDRFDSDSADAIMKGIGKAKIFDLKSPESFKGSSIKDAESYLDDALSGFEKQPLKRGEGIRYFDGKGNSWQLNYGYENATDAVHRSPYLKTTVNGEIIRIPLK